MVQFNEQNFYAKIKLRDEESLACFIHFRKILGDDNLSTVQQLTTDYSQSKAETFFKENKAFFDVEENRVRFFNFMRSLHADKPHSGKRFSEELFKIVWEYTKTLKAQESSESGKESTL